MWLKAQDRDVLEVLVRTSDHAFLASMPDGTCMWANDAFLRKMKYTESELTGYKKEDGTFVEGKKWPDFTVPDENLDADVQAVGELERGERQEYRCQKQYIPKNSKPEDVVIQVVRYPLDGGLKEFKFCLVSVMFLDDAREMQMAVMIEGMTKMLTQIVSLMTEMQARLTKMETKEDDQTDANIMVNSGIRLLSKVPKKFWWALIGIVGSLVGAWGGNEILQIIKAGIEATSE